MNGCCVRASCPAEQYELIGEVWYSSCEECPYWVSSGICTFEECGSAVLLGGDLHRDYLREHNPIQYNCLLLSGELWIFWRREELFIIHLSST